jgi:hypothetical protein
VSAARWTALVISAFLLLLPGCHRNSESFEPQYIMLTFNNGACQQNGTNGVVEVVANQPVIFQGATGYLSQFQIDFSNCPFASCPVSSPAGDSANVGKPTPGSAGTTFHYAGMSINHERCTGTENMGLRVRPAS